MKRERVQQDRLTELEHRLRADLLPALRSCADRTNTNLFVSKRHMPPDWPPVAAGEETDSFLRQCDLILELYSRLGLDAKDSLASVFANACHESTAMSNHHRLGPQRLAEKLLSKLESK